MSHVLWYLAGCLTGIVAAWIVADVTVNKDKGEFVCDRAQHSDAHWMVN